MTEKTVTWVSDISAPDERGNRYVNVVFADGDSGYLGKKEFDAALEVQGLLEEAKDKPTDFILEDTGKKNNKGKTKYKIKGIGTYQPTPYVQGGGVTSSPSAATTQRNRSPEQFIYELEYEQERMDRRTALMQAVSLIEVPPEQANALDHMWPLHLADDFYEWLRQTVRTEGHIDTTAGVGATPSTASNHGAEVQSVSMAVGLEREGQAGVSDTGKVTASACPPHDLNLDVVPKAMRYPCRKCNAWVKPVDAQ